MDYASTGRNTFVDLGLIASSSVYGLFEPSYLKRSLGIFTLLKEIEHCRETGLGWLYPGYPTRESSACYKKQFRSTEWLDWANGEWKPPG